MKQETPLEELRNKDLLHLLIKQHIAGDNCVRFSHIDAHTHFAQARMTEDEILSRMHQPNMVKIKVK